MSRENVVFFSKAINTHPELNKRVSDSEPTMEAWTKIAHDAGFEFTPEEFADVIGETLGRTVTVDNAVREYLGAQYLMGSSELSNKALESVAGGLMRIRTNEDLAPPPSYRY
jgi:predicted ribosomally synthesized peptide with nif11-like leader